MCDDKRSIASLQVSAAEVQVAGVNPAERPAGAIWTRSAEGGDLSLT